ncbi:MAG: DUF1816 domain-containing protein [Hydrococcus sp. Prado102]|jgi:hypothetical protein|nr:DUF1816 domain-containing protein [Hydrococcus sp. Prado102]
MAQRSQVENKQSPKSAETIMNALWKSLKENSLDIFQNLGWAWWIEIVTQNPLCIYYFGPFLSAKEAQAAEAGYLEDLEQEGAQGIAAKIKRCKPQNLTISEDLGDKIDSQVPVSTVRPELASKSKPSFLRIQNYDSNPRSRFAK